MEILPKNFQQPKAHLDRRATLNSSPCSGDQMTADVWAATDGFFRGRRTANALRLACTA